MLNFRISNVFIYSVRFSTSKFSTSNSKTPKLQNSKRVSGVGCRNSFVSAVSSTVFLMLESTLALFFWHSLLQTSKSSALNLLFCPFYALCTTPLGYNYFLDQFAKTSLSVVWTTALGYSSPLLNYAKPAFFFGQSGVRDRCSFELFPSRTSSPLSFM